MAPTGSKGTFSPGWYYQPGTKGPLVPGAKNAETNAKLGHRSKVCSLVVLPFLVSQKKEKKLCYFRVKILHPLKALISLGRKPIACMLAFSGGARDKMKGGRAIVNIFFLENRKIPVSVTVYMPSLTSQP